MARLSKKKVTEALRRYNGNMSKSAQACGVVRPYLYEYVKKHDMWPIVEQCREKVLDDLEEKALEIALRGNNSMLQFLLKNQGRQRGYADRLDQTSDGTQRVIVTYDRSEAVDIAQDADESTEDS